jgi:murein DD-endopeptidase MepM/ murein hydrolase activator NlpD
MTRKVHTIIFVPHARARFRQVRVTTRALATFGTVIALLLVAGLVSSVLFLRSLRTGREVSSLLAENQGLRDRARVLNGRLETIEKQLADFEEKTRRLSIVAGLSATRDSGTGGVGGLLAPSADPGASAERGLLDATRRGALLASRLGAIEKGLAAQAEQLALTPTIAPTLGVLTAGFGQRSDPFTGEPEHHTGIDISTPAGNRIYAPASGTVVRVEWQNGYGRTLEISHGYGVTTLYGHLEAARVAEGQRVKRGDLIGLVGSSGRSTGPHLHYEVHLTGKPVDPLGYVLNAF